MNVVQEGVTRTFDSIKNEAVLSVERNKASLRQAGTNGVPVRPSFADDIERVGVCHLNDGLHQVGCSGARWLNANGVEQVLIDARCRVGAVGLDGCLHCVSCLGKKSAVFASRAALQAGV